MPRVGRLVHRVEVESRLELGLSARQEHDAGDGGRHAASEELERVVGDLLGSRALLAVGTGGDHRGLEEDSLEDDALVGHVLEGLFFRVSSFSFENF